MTLKPWAFIKVDKDQNCLACGQSCRNVQVRMLNEPSDVESVPGPVMRQFDTGATRNTDGEKEGGGSINASCDHTLLPSGRCYTCGGFREVSDIKPATEDRIGHPKHYTQGIECWDYITSHKMGYLEGNIVKYITRYKDKGGAEDLLKARAYLDRLIQEVSAP